ncbi:MAG: iron-sulfur cluster assembly accessory protein [Alphaproteobacteria bacterium]|nr:iron-sulfur cluster assembly accessory protein [Alphaproteobacteria bacterium]MDA7982819.1 iron-sulfur cluster assembly accessory protein [Alphaproteobacteria bacterium]MDA7985194.1 iron-sulfur cluster assembly accessory protein [Alphaproteobacteria bacterium]MDA7987119.1 iron-sulfur cluster assembly accessory protein [Alphaproteobacteria bacterium]MDA7988383.1 iron-sulfur cluster assembly accessory protein [Alphaproteobacteria bacterium]
MSPPPLLRFTDAAAERLGVLLSEAGEASPAGMRVGVRARGCNGLSYYMEYAHERAPGDHEVNVRGLRLFVDTASVLYLVGSEVDWRADSLSAGFVFRNPNEAARCGCGESFSVSAPSAEGGDGGGAGGGAAKK